MGVHREIQKGRGMKSLLKTILVGAALAVAGVALSAGAVDPVLGTWTLNVAKSTFDPGPPPKSQTRTYAQSDKGVSLTFTGVAADGSAISGQSTFKYDGKPYPMTGSKDYDAISLKRVNGSTVKSTMMRAGQEVGTTTRSISGHGKILTLTTKIVGTDGKPYSVVAVYDKQ
jgi:hypothetical protein